MTSGIMNATLVGAFFNGAVKIANCVSTDMDISVAIRDTTSKDSAGWKTGAPGLRSWSGSASCKFDQSANYTYDQLFALVDARTTFTFYWSTGVTGDKKYAGSAIITSLKKSSPMEDNVTFECSFEGTGALAETII